MEMRLSPGTCEHARRHGGLQCVLDRAEALRFVRITLGGHVLHEVHVYFLLLRLIPPPAFRPPEEIQSFQSSRLRAFVNPRLKLLLN